ncbi:MAG TPA: hypothetical protein VFV72_15555 [Candidatus Limnocylindrales bacterium]|nr:hypothetical protein [Candidatus Limnocylindrales bacterium]
MGEGTDAALAKVVAARANLAAEVDRLEAAGRDAVDIPAKIRRSPAKAAAIAGGGAFLVLGGPKRVLRAARKAITGHEEPPLPKHLLPKDIEKTLKRMGSDGDKVRGTIERDFAKYLDDREKQRKKEGLQAALTALLLTAVRPAAQRAGKQVAERMLDPSAPGFQEQLEKIRQRRSAVDAATHEDLAAGGGPESGVGI